MDHHWVVDSPVAAAAEDMCLEAANCASSESSHWRRSIVALEEKVNHPL